MLVLLRRTSFLTPFYSLYFSHLTQYILQIACWASEGSFHVLCSSPVLCLVCTPQASVSICVCVLGEMDVAGGMPVASGQVLHL